MKKGIKILIICLCMVIVGLVTFIIVDKLILKRSNNESTTTSSNENGANTVETKVSAKEIIKAEIEKKEFLEKNGIKESEVSLLEYRIIENGDNPVFIVSVGYTKENEPEHGKIFQVTYNGNTVNFDVIEDHKYLSDSVTYDTSNKILRLQAEYHDGERINYFKLGKEKFEQVDLALKDSDKSYHFEKVKAYGLNFNKTTQNATDDKSGTSTTKKNETVAKKNEQEDNEMPEVNGEYVYFDKTNNYYHESHIKLSNQTVSGVNFEISTAHGMDVDHVSVGDVKGKANSIAVPEELVIPNSEQHAYEFTEDVDGKKCKITIVYTAYRMFEYVNVTEDYQGETNPYGGHGIFFEGEYEKNYTLK